MKKFDYLKALDLIYSKGQSVRTVAKALDVSRTTIDNFITKFEEYDKTILSYPLPPIVTNETIEDCLYKKQKTGPKLDEYRALDYEKIANSLKQKGETLKHQWRKYNSEGIVEGKKPYSYRQYCQLFNDWVSNEYVTAHIFRNPGENMELDYAGMQLYIKNRFPSQTDIPVTIFVATLSYSGYFYCEGLTSCNERNWIRVCNNAISYFKGITPIITCDNCKVAVKENKDWIDPTINETFQNWALYYDVTILPAAVRSPTWKPKVEGSVGVVTRDILVEMNEMTFFSLDELNSELWDRMDERNKENYTKQDYSRTDLYKNEEKATLMPLPSHLFQYMQRVTAKVAPNLAVTFDGNYYTMLKRYVGTMVEIRATDYDVAIYTLDGLNLIKKYPRSFGKHQWIYDESTKPKTSSDYSNWSPSMFMRWASQIGPNTEEVINAMMEAKSTPNQAFRACFGVLAYSNRYGEVALEECCAKAMAEHRPYYSYIKDLILGYPILSTSKTKKKKGVETLKPALDKEMVYKANDEKYSLSALLKKQEKKDE